MKTKVLRFGRQLFLLVLTLSTTFSLKAQLPASPNAWSIVASYNISGKASGLAWDGTYIYYGIYGSNGNMVYKFNPANGTSNLLCTAAFDDAYGMTYKGPNLVTIQQPTSSAQPAMAHEFSMTGAQISTLNLPNHYMSGIAWDNGNWWVCTYYPDPGTVYHLDGTGGVISQFTPPAAQPWDICKQGNDLWIADYNANMLYKVSSSGTLLESHASQGIKPSGVVFDGTYLWYCDGQLSTNSTLYKVDLSGIGTPAINIPTTNYSYGTVTIGSSATWNCQVQNTGTAPLIISSVQIPAGTGVTTSFSTPYTISAGGSAVIPFVYSPTNSNLLNTQVYVNSNDPIHPQMTLTLTGTPMFAGPHLNLGTNTHDYGERRSGAYSRWKLQISNTGNQNLAITNLDMTDPAFIVDNSVSLPINLSPQQTDFIGIWFHPDAGGVFDGQMMIHSNDPQQPVLTVNLQGVGIDTVYPQGAPLWTYLINASTFDNSPKAIGPIDDITGDGVNDLIICSEDNYVRCFNGNASVSGDVMWETLIYSGNIYHQNAMTTIEDINNDGYADVIVGTTGGDRSIIALSGKTGAQLWKKPTTTIGGGGWVYQVFVKYDYNNDGVQDVLACAGNDGGNTGPKRVYCLNGLTGVSIWEAPLDGAMFSVIGVEDFTGDGKPDVVAGGTTGNETAGRVYGINGLDGSVKWTSVPVGTSTWALMQLNDVTGDGIKDIASGDFAGKVYIHNAVSGFKEKVITIPNSLILRFENMGDVNQDGNDDILVAHSGTNGIVLSGLDLSTIWLTSLADKSWNVANAGDVDWDGINDAGIGTLYQNNFVYFLNGTNGSMLSSSPSNTPIDALGSISDIVGDNSRELVAGGRNGAVVCISGGYDPSVGIEEPSKIVEQGLSVYPNPCEQGFTLSFVQFKGETIIIELIDLNGKIVYSETLNSQLSGRFEKYFTRSVCNPTAESRLLILKVKTGKKVMIQKVLFL